MAWMHGTAAPKPEKRSTTKGRADRAEAKVKKAVRAECVERDGYCRIGSLNPSAICDRFGEELFVPSLADGCDGPSEWCHMHVRRRSQTRNLAPEIRHTTRYSFIACRQHHDQYDGRQKPRLLVTALTRKGANGPLKFKLGRMESEA